MARKSPPRKKTVNKKTTVKKSAHKKTAARKKTGRKSGAQNKSVTPRKGTPRRAAAETNPSKVRHRRWLRPLLGLLLIGFLCFAAYLLWLDYEVTSRFEGKRWAIPARVYARPLELYSGKSLTVAQLLDELKLLGYRSTAHPEKPGSYSRRRGHFRLHNRAFVFWDEQAPSRILDLTIKSGRITRLQGGDGKPLALARLA